MRWSRLWSRSLGAGLVKREGRIRRQQRPAQDLRSILDDDDFDRDMRLARLQGFRGAEAERALCAGMGGRLAPALCGIGAILGVAFAAGVGAVLGLSLGVLAPFVAATKICIPSIILTPRYPYATSWGVTQLGKVSEERRCQAGLLSPILWNSPLVRGRSDLIPR